MGSSLWTPGVNYNLGPTSVSVIGATRSDNLRNNDISWEELSEVNIGIDLEMFDSKFIITADYFFGDLSDLLAQSLFLDRLATIDHGPQSMLCRWKEKV